MRARVAGLLALALLVMTAPAARSEPGLKLLSETALSPRLTEFKFFSPALDRSVFTRVLTPDNFDPASEHLPVLWLLHGGFGSSRDWTEAGGVQALTKNLRIIVVMPDAGTGGWYTNWLRNTQEGPQRWETFHLDELRPWLESRFQTRTDRHGRAIAGLSMGGFGAMHYAALHPDLFGFAASFSGAVDLLHPGITGVVTISPLAHNGVPGDIFGDPVTDRANWRAHNPVDLAAHLRYVVVQLRTGNGQPGGPHGGGTDLQEMGVSEATRTLHERLVALHIGHVYRDYGPGAHNYAYWHDYLRDTIPGLMKFFEG